MPSIFMRQYFNRLSGTRGAFSYLKQFPFGLSSQWNVTAWIQGAQ
jgi:hypothetical protein